MKFQEWLEDKYTEWERGMPTRQSYYNFARYLDVPHTAMTQWVSGVSLPSGDDLAKLASKLGNDIYTMLEGSSTTIQSRGIERSMSGLPAALTERLVNAITETEQAIRQRRLEVESSEAKILAVKIFEKWGFRISG
jgi:hypothetical protein